MSQKIFSFSGECILQRNGIEVPLKNNKAKTKTFRLLSSQGQGEPLVNSSCVLNILVGNSEEILYTCKLDRLQKVYSSFMSEGRLTLQILEEAESSMKRVNIHSDISLKTAMQVERFLLIMIKGVTAEILKSFCNILYSMKCKKSVPDKSTSQGSQPSSSSNSGPINNVKGDQKIQVRKTVTGQSNSKENSMNKVLRKPSQEAAERSKFKVNKNILDDLKREQANTTAALKRNHSALANYDPSIKNIEKETKKYKLSKSILKILPESILRHILKFLTPKEFISQKLISKDFYKLIASLRTRLDFRGKGDLPSFIVIKYLNNSPNLQTLYMGPSKHLIQRHFLDEMHLDLPRLKFVDLTGYVTLSDKMVAKIYRKCKAIEVLKFGYYSGVTDTVVDTLPTYLDKVKGFYIKCSNKNYTERRDKFTDTCLAKFLTRYDKLGTFSLYISGSSFFKQAFNNPLSNLTVIKFEQILFYSMDDLDLISNLAQCENLEFLKIGNIRIGQMDLNDLSRERTMVFGGLFAGLTKLKTLKLGQFAGNYMMSEIAQNVPNLRKFVLGSDFVNDDGLTPLLKRADSLYHLDISRCKSIGGHCFEDICSEQFRRLIVSFDEHRCRCVHEIFLAKGILGQLMLININKRRA